MRRNEFTVKIQKFIDSPMVMGDKTKGWDCLNILDEFYRSIGKKFPEEYKGINKDNYVKEWESGKAKKIYREFLLTLGSSVDQNYAIEGDLFIFDGAETAFPGIYLGRGHILMTFDKGIRTVPLKIIKRLYKFVDVRRLS